MPRATVDTKGVAKDLKSLEGGKVTIRKMPYSEYQKRREILSKMKITGQGRKFEGSVDIPFNEVVIFEFSRCIVEHNLEDDNGNLMDFSKPVTYQVLDPVVGEEISKLIEELNQFNKIDDEDEIKNLFSALNGESSSTQATTTRK